MINYGMKSVETIPLYMVLMIIVLSFTLLLKFAYKYNLKLANVMNKIFSWCVLLMLVIAPVIIIAVIIFIVYVIIKYQLLYRSSKNAN